MVITERNDLLILMEYNVFPEKLKGTLPFYKN